AGKYLQIASFIMLAYDHSTFSSMPILSELFRCDNYVLFEGSCTVALVAGKLLNVRSYSRAVILILRVVAIYEGSKKIFAFLLSLWAAQLIISAVGLRTGLGKVISNMKFYLAEPDIKPIGAPFNQLLTCTMISRLVLNLRSLS
ncbi:hypothetical protein AGABI2DRAFT_54710, partial [Agaricus bisporus var. bisporus H97]|uniref:hypothetical protein n=1 Tax=Agaricus bisporus var. bisporus (strain H97 / ATCC MYA-4626 / FGSC 10389) TaxID=936046 RepID=UPI00029F6EF5